MPNVLDKVKATLAQRKQREIKQKIDDRQLYYEYIHGNAADIAEDSLDALLTRLAISTDMLLVYGISTHTFTSCTFEAANHRWKCS